MREKLLLALLSVSLFIASCKKEAPVETPAPVDTQEHDHLLLGNPTNAVPDPPSNTNYLKNNVYYTVGYHALRGIPAWVSWHFQREDIGSTPRQDDFRDDNLPASFYAVSHESYIGSGFDRGHNCPSGDRTFSVQANSSTFLMTNIIPQAPRLNQGPWEGLEDYIRNTLVGTTREAYVIMGNYGAGGKGSQGEATAIDNGRVTVPQMVWKVVVVMPKGNNDLQRLDTSATVVVVNMPNNNDLYTVTASGKTDWRNYLTTISVLEQNARAAGVPLTLLDKVNETVRTYLKSKKFQ